MNEGEQQNDFYRDEAAPEHAFGSTKRNPEESEATLSDGIEWTASEFIDHQKGASWFVLLGFAALALSAVAYFGTNRDIFGPIVIIILSIIFGMGAARRPRVLQYSLSPDGLRIGEKLYPYESFRAFALINEGPVESIMLLSTKRWDPAISLYLSPENADDIMNTLGSFVPLEDHQPGYVDKFLRKIRF